MHGRLIKRMDQVHEHWDDEMKIVLKQTVIVVPNVH
jgi:hypothetical protein